MCRRVLVKVDRVHRHSVCDGRERERTHRLSVWSRLHPIMMPRGRIHDHQGVRLRRRRGHDAAGREWRRGRAVGLTHRLYARPRALRVQVKHLVPLPHLAPDEGLPTVRACKRSVVAVVADMSPHMAFMVSKGVFQVFSVPVLSFPLGGVVPHPQIDSWATRVHVLNDGSTLLLQYCYSLEDEKTLSHPGSGHA